MRSNAAGRIGFRAGALGVVVAVALGTAASGSSSASTTAKKSGGGSADKLLQQMKQAGYAHVGVVDQPPYSNITVSGSLTGLAPQLTGAILKSLGVKKMVGVTATYGTAIPGLQAGRWQMLASALDITPQRCSQVLFSNPIDADPDGFAVKTGNPLGLHTLKNVVAKHATLGILSGSEEIQVAEKAGVPSSSISTYQTDTELQAALEDGRIDAAMGASTAFKTFQHDGKWQATGNIHDGLTQAAALAFPKSAKALRNAFNQQLTKMERNGQFAKIAKKWGFDPTSVKGITTAASCKASI